MELGKLLSSFVNVRSIVAGTAIALVAASGAAAGAPPGGAGGSGGNAPTQPTESQRTVARALREIGQAAQRTCDDLRGISRRGVANIARLDRQSADDAAIASAAAENKSRQETRANNGLSRVETVKAAALEALAANGGTQEQIDRVTTSAANATNRINTCETNGNTAIDNAVERAAGDDGSGGPG